MKKGIILLVVFCILFISLSACGNNVEKAYPWDIGNVNTLSFNDDKLVISIESNTLSPTGATFIIKNIGSEDISFGQAYTIQIEIDDKWYFIDKTQDFTLSSIMLMPNESISFDLDWTNTFGELPSAKYRLIKEYSTQSDSAHICCEFLIS